MRANVTALLMAFFAFGFFAAGLLSVFWLLAITGPSAAAALVIAVVQGDTLLHALGMSVAGFALAQVGYGIGLVRVAALRDRCIPD